MGERIQPPVKIVREEGYLYFTKNDPVAIYRAKMQHKGRKKGKTTSIQVLRTGIKRTKGYLFYIDGSGFLCKAKMKRR